MSGEPMVLEAVVCRENMQRAWQRVRSNRGAAGVDGLTIDQSAERLRDEWPRIREELLAGSYTPQPVRRVDIPKPGGGVRTLGIPTVTDRLIQQAMAQVLQPHFDRTFSASSFGYRPGRSAQDAVKRARGHIAAGNRWMVDMDLAKFFDRVNHDVLMARLARRIEDKRLLRLIRRYLQAGLMAGGLISPRREGTPQGGPLSPLLSNILLDDLDKELERRGHAFVRYADDCSIFVQSERAGQRVLASVSRFLEKRLRLQVNQAKSAVARPWKRSFLGYTVTPHRQPRLKVAPRSVQRLRQKAKALMRQGRGPSPRSGLCRLVSILIGWLNYFSLAEVRSTFETLDGWLPSTPACHSMAPVEATRYAAASVDRTGTGCRSRLEICGQRSGPLVECWREPHEPGDPDPLSALVGSCLPRRGTSETVACFLNRRGTDPYARWCGRAAPARGTLPD